MQNCILSQSQKKPNKTVHVCTAPEGYKRLGRAEFLYNKHMKVARLPVLGSGRLYLSRNHSSSDQTISMIYSESIFVPLGIQHEMRMRHIVVCVLSDSTMLFHIITQTARFLERRCLEKICVLVVFPNLV